MRNRRILTILGSSAVGLLLLAMSGSPNRLLRAELDTSSSSVTTDDPVGPGPGSMFGSLDEARLEKQARQAAAAAVADRNSRLAADRAARRRASRSATRQRLRPARPPTPAPSPVGHDNVWAKLRRCEAGGDYTRNSGNGYYGAYQFSAGTWRGLGYPGFPHQAPPEVQDEAARKLQRRSGWGQWPACSRRIGVR
jgi:hypothetical protein